MNAKIAVDAGTVDARCIAGRHTGGWCWAFGPEESLERRVVAQERGWLTVPMSTATSKVVTMLAVAVVDVDVAEPRRRDGDGLGGRQRPTVLGLPPRPLGKGVVTRDAPTFAPRARRPLLGALYLRHGTGIARVTELAGNRGHGRVSMSYRWGLRGPRDRNKCALS